VYIFLVGVLLLLTFKLKERKLISSFAMQQVYVAMGTRQHVSTIASCPHEDKFLAISERISEFRPEKASTA
jgi:hypothetical protein